MLRFLPIALLCGCVLPLPIQGEVPEETLPPFFDPGCQLPKPAAPEYEPLTDPETIEYSVCGVRDPNAEDRLYYRWFINYGKRGDFRPFETGVERGLVNTEEGSTISTRVSPCGDAVFPDGEDQPDKLHRVELIIADRPFLARSEEPEDHPTPNQVLPEDAHHVRVTWYLQFQNSCD